VHAIVINAIGGPEVLEWSEVTDPTAGPGQVLIDVAYGGINYIDTYHRTGLYPMELPLIPGLEGAGSVIAVGDGADKSLVGRAVAWTGQIGSYAERVVAPANRIVPLPDGVSLQLGAAVMLQGLTAHYLAADTYTLRPGDRCLIHAAAGGVGRLLVQIAKLAGAEVFGTVGSDEKVAIARSAGADHVINYQTTSFKDAIEDIAGPHALAVVYDGVGAATFDDGLDLLAPRGVMATFGNASGPVPPVSPLRLSAGGSLYLTRPTLFAYIAEDEVLAARSADLFRWMASGELDVRIGAVHPLARAAEAHRALEGRGIAGKILLEV
jgi:NADPH2:quinone reductase